MSKLTLVTSDTPVPADSAPKYTAAEREAIEAYQATLQGGRYYKHFDSGSPTARIISGNDPTLLPLSFLSSDFADFCKETGRKLPKKMPTADYLAYSMKSVTGTKFAPNGPELIRAAYSRHRYVNTYKRFEPQHAPIVLSPLFLDFMRRLFPVPEEFHIFCQYIGHAIRFPEERPSWHLMLPSESGVGKGFLFNDIISPLFSMQTKLVKTFRAATGQFGGTIFSNSIWLMLDDCKAGSDNTETQMKSLLSEERTYVEPKGKDGAMESIYTRVILASNEDVPAPVEEQTRRWCIFQKLTFCNGLKGKAGQKERQARIKVLAAWMKEPGAMEAIHNFYFTYPLEATDEHPAFDHKNVPITASFELMVAKSETPEQSFTADFLERHPTKILKLEELQAEFVSAKMGKPGNSTVADLLKSCGYRMEILTKPSRLRWWFPASMSKVEAEAILDAKSDF